MAKRRKTRRRRTYSRPRRYYRRAKRRVRRTRRITAKPMMSGLIAGAAGQFASGYIGGYGQPIADLAVGFIQKDKTLKVIGARAMGQMLVAQFQGGNGSNNTFGQV